MLSKSQIISREHKTQSLKELFEFTNNYLYFLTEEALSNLSQPNTKASTHSVVSLREQASSSTAIPGPNNPSITSLTDYLSSNTDKNEIDRFDEDFFSIGT